MNENKLKKKILIFTGIVAVMLISISLVMAYRYSQTPLSLVLHENSMQKATETIADNNVKASTSIPDKASTTAVLGYKKPVTQSREKISSINNKSDAEKYASVSHETHAGFSRERHKDDVVDQKYEMKQAGQETGPAAPSLFPESGNNGSTTTTAGRKSKDHITRNESFYPWKAENDESGADKEYQERTEALNYDVTVSRNFISGGYDSGTIEVVLSVYVDNPPNGLIVKEYIPEGWDVQESNPDYKNYDSSSGEIKWLFIGTDIGNMKITYRILKRKALSGSSFRGNFLYNNLDGAHVTMQIDGANGV